MVGARPGEDVHDRARGPAGFGGVSVRLHHYLGNRVQRRPHANGPDETFVVVDTVDEVVVQDVVLAVHRHGRRLPAVVGTVAGRERVREPLVGARRHARQGHHVPAWQQQVLHGPLPEERAHRGAAGLDEGRLRLHRDGHRDGADDQLCVDAKPVARRHLHVAVDGAEPLQLDAQVVAPDGKEGERVVAGVSGYLRAGVTGRRVRNRHGGARQRPAILVRHPA